MHSSVETDIEGARILTHFSPKARESDVAKLQKMFESPENQRLVSYV